jgi:hypothetical protein
MLTLESPQIERFQKLKLVLLYALRYEGDEKVPILVEKLKGQGQTSVNTHSPGLTP